MPLYEVNHTLLGPGPSGIVDPTKADGDRSVFRPGATVSTQELIDAGFTGKRIDEMLTGKPGGFSAALTLVKGTDDTEALLKRLAPATLKPDDKK